MCIYFRWGHEPGQKPITQLTDNKITIGIEELLLAREKHYGRLEGEENKSRFIIENMIVNYGFTDEQAAKAAAVTIDFVKKIRAGLAAKRKEE